MNIRNHDRDAGSEIDRVWELRRSDSRERWPDLVLYAHHPDPTVRGEAISVLGKWRVASAVAVLERLLAEDADSGVRERCALALGAIGEAHGSKPGVQALRNIVLSLSAAPSLREAAYQSLLWMHGRGHEAPLARVPEDLSWVVSLADST